jgi:hypothetical protein
MGVACHKALVVIKVDICPAALCAVASTDRLKSAHPAISPLLIRFKLMNSDSRSPLGLRPAIAALHGREAARAGVLT